MQTGQDYMVFFDNYFSSVILLEDLKKDQVLACGTSRGNRKNLSSLAADKGPHRKR
jgi:hypothetical protein